MTKDIYLITTTPDIDLKHSVNISWHTSFKGSYLLYKEQEELLYQKAYPYEEYWSLEENYEADEYLTKRYVCHINLNALKPGTDYCYQIVVNDITSETHYFKTAGEEKQDVFLTFADFQYSENLLTLELIKQFTENNPDSSLITCTGDLADEASSEASHRYLLDSDCFQNHILACAVGDHEYWGRRTKPYVQFKRPYTYNKLFSNPQNGILELINTSYYFKYNNILFIILNCGDSNAQADNDLFIKQAKWLDEILTKEQNYQFSIVCMHKSLYGDLEQDPHILGFRKLYVPVFDKHQIDLVISGHDHEYSRTHVIKNNQKHSKGTIYLDLGSSGSKVRNTGIAIKNSLFYDKYLDLKEKNYALGCKGIVQKNRLVLEIRNQYYDLIDQFSLESKRKI